MNEKIAVVADDATLVGYRLAGVDECVAVTPESAEKELLAMLDKPGVGILITPTDVLDHLSPKARKRAEGSTKPVVVTIPPRGALPGAKGGSIAKLVKRVIGIELK